jgi:MFS family permease
MPTVIAAAILLFGWLGISTWQGFVVFGVFYGFFSGTLVSLPPAVVVSLTEKTEMNKVGTRMGMAFRYPSPNCLRSEANLYSIISFATLTGTPIAGALLSHDNGGFTDAIIFSAVVMIAGFVFLFAARTARVGLQIRKKT